MPDDEKAGIEQSMRFEGADLVIRARLAQSSLTIEIAKSGAVVHRVVLDHATDPLEHAWLAELFAKDERVHLNDLARQLDDYVGGLNTNQG